MRQLICIIHQTLFSTLTVLASILSVNVRILSAFDSSFNLRTLINDQLSSNVSNHRSKILSSTTFQRNVFLSEINRTNFLSPYEPIFEPCDLLLNEFKEVVENFTDCIMANSLPPRVCTRCANYYIALEKVYYILKDSSDIKASNGMSCNLVIFSMYDTAYVQNLYDVLSDDVWSNSQCTDCLEFVISPQFVISGVNEIIASRTGNYRFNNRTEKILSLYNRWYDCVRNAGGSSDMEELAKKNATIICGECWTEYEDLNLFYEESIMLQKDFCVDIDSAQFKLRAHIRLLITEQSDPVRITEISGKMVNDTIRFWRQEMHCAFPALPTKRSEAVFVALISLAVFALTVIFYIGSYMQGSRKKRRLKKYRSGYQFGSIAAGINNDIVQEYINESRWRLPEAEALTGRRSGERTPLLFAGGRRILSYSQLPPSNLG